MKIGLRVILDRIGADEVEVIQTQENYTLYMTDVGVLRVYAPSGDNSAVASLNDYALTRWAGDNGVGPRVLDHWYGGPSDGHWYLLEINKLPTDANFPQFVRNDLAGHGRRLRSFHLSELPEGVQLERPKLGLDRVLLVEFFVQEAIRSGQFSSFAATAMKNLRNVSQKVPSIVALKPALVHLNLRAAAFSDAGLTDFQCAVQLEKGDPDLRYVDIAKIVAEADLSTPEVETFVNAAFGTWLEGEARTGVVNTVLAMALTEAVLTLVYNEAKCLAHPPRWHDRVDSLLQRVIDIYL
jgi:hypothetical protein